MLPRFGSYSFPEFDSSSADAPPTPRRRLLVFRDGESGAKVRRLLLIAGLGFAEAAGIACAPALRPLSGKLAPSVVPHAALPLGYHQIVFDWELQDRELAGRGEGVARIAAPDSARLDLFLGGGFGSGVAVLIDDSLQVPGGSMARRLIPPPPLLWAALGRLAVPAFRDTCSRSSAYKRFSLLMLRFGARSSVLLGLLLAGCGIRYGFAGGGLPSNIRTMAVLPFDNQTTSPEVQRDLLDAMRKELQRRLGVRDASESRADAIVRGVISAYDVDVPVAVSANPSTAVTARRRLQVTVDVEIVEQANGRVLFQRKGMRGEGDYDERAEPEGRRQAIQVIVNAIVEGAQSQW
ncbi:MAG: hypothetical protein DMD26_10640 [Gemmatimonadetes bacterium]|nr:MAG: hypothetical protein DMD26_10640 [Gemmatimonadota bacterium]